MHKNLKLDISNKTLLSRTVEFLRFPLVILVVFIHCYGSEVDMRHLDLFKMNGTDVYNLIRIILSHNLAHIAVPAFYLISGYYFFTQLRQWNTDVYINKLKKRFWTLLLPYLFWNVISIIWDYTPSIIFFFQGRISNPFDAFIENYGIMNWLWACHAWGGYYNWLGYHVENTGPYCIQLWFVRDLMILCLLAPLIYFLIKNLKLITITLVALIYIVDIALPIGGFSITSLFFFSFGAYFSIVDKNMLAELRKSEPYIIFLTLILLGAAVANECYALNLIFIKRLFIICGVISLFSVASHGIKNKTLSVHKWLTQSTFFIYASHMLFLMPVVRTIRKIITSEDVSTQTFVYFLIPIVIVVLCILVYHFLKLIFPRTTALLTGNR